MFHYAFLPIIVVAALNIGLGMLWYSPALFGTLWAKEHRFEYSDLKPTALHYIGAIIVSLITVIVFYNFVHWFNITKISEGIKLGFWIWLGFIATTHFSGVIWAKKPYKAYLVDTGFQLASMVMMGAILSVWW